MISPELRWRIPYYEAYREMVIPAGPAWVAEHLKRLTANGIQAHFMLADVGSLKPSNV